MPRKGALKEEEEWCGCGGKCECHRGCGCGIFFAVLIMLFGVIWLGNELKWWALNVPWLPILVIFFGLWLITKKLCKSCGGCCGCAK